MANAFNVLFPVTKDGLFRDETAVHRFIELMNRIEKNNKSKNTKTKLTMIREVLNWTSADNEIRAFMTHANNEGLMYKIASGRALNERDTTIKGILEELCPKMDEIEMRNHLKYVKLKNSVKITNIDHITRNNCIDILPQTFQHSNLQQLRLQVKLLCETQDISWAVKYKTKTKAGGLP